MTPDSAQTEPKTQTTALPHPQAAVPRLSEKLGLPGFFSDLLKPLLITSLSGVAGYLFARFAPASIIESFPPRAQNLLMRFNFITPEGEWSRLRLTLKGVTLGGIYSAYQHWRKDKSKQLGVKDIHEEIYTVLEPATLKSETEQNSRIQDGLQTLVKRSDQPARGPHSKALLQESLSSTHTL